MNALLVAAVVAIGSIGQPSISATESVAVFHTNAAIGGAQDLPCYQGDGSMWRPGTLKFDGGDPVPQESETIQRSAPPTTKADCAVA